jgi:hypothetical protein
MRQVLRSARRVLAPASASGQAVSRASRFVMDETVTRPVGSDGALANWCMGFCRLWYAAAQLLAGWASGACPLGIGALPPAPAGSSHSGARRRHCWSVRQPPPVLVHGLLTARGDRGLARQGAARRGRRRPVHGDELPDPRVRIRVSIANASGSADGFPPTAHRPPPAAHPELALLPAARLRLASVAGPVPDFGTAGDRALSVLIAAAGLASRADPAE